MRTSNAWGPDPRVLLFALGEPMKEMKVTELASSKIFHARIDDNRPGDGWERGWKTPRITTPGGEFIQAEFTAHFIRGNRCAYISVTATTWTKHGIEDGGGCMHTEVLAAFPELAPLVALHLVDTDGQPRHYGANAGYWAEYVMGLNKYKLSVGVGDPRDLFNSQVIAGIVPDDDERIAEIFEPIEVSAPKGIVFEQYASSEGGLTEQRAILNERVLKFCVRRINALSVHVAQTLKDFRIFELTKEN